jgi:hypothetical protein
VCFGITSADLGALLVADYIKKELGKKTAKVVTVNVDSRGGVSGGTIASGARCHFGMAWGHGERISMWCGCG